MQNANTSRNTQKHRNYVFTINNPTDEHRDILGAIECRHVLYQPERGENTSTLHFQGLIMFKNPRSFEAVRTLIPGWHVEPMRGTYEEAKNYCTKAETRAGDICSRGDPPAGQGSRTDLELLQESIKAGASRRELFDAHFGVAVRYGRGIDEALRYYEPRRDFKSVVYWYYGPTGSGKSRAASAEAPHAYWKGSGKWWSGYDGDEDVIIDDYRKDFFPFDELLRLLDRYPMQVETKGGHAQFRAKRIFITTCFDPYSTWAGETAENIQQLLRRIEYTKEFRVKNTPDLS